MSPNTTAPNPTQYEFAPGIMQGLVNLIHAALAHESPRNDHHQRLLLFANGDYEIGLGLYCYLTRLAADRVREDGFGSALCFEHVVADRLHAGLVLPGAEECFDVTLGHIARLAIGMPISFDLLEDWFEVQDPMCAVGVAYALLHGIPQPVIPG